MFIDGKSYGDVSLKSAETYTASRFISMSYAQTLKKVRGLSDEKHTLRLVSKESGKWHAVDYAVTECSEEEYYSDASLNLARTPAATVIGSVPSPWAVSYTHLDVYKRQLLTLCGAEREKDNAHMVFRGATDILLGNLAESVPMEEKREDKRSTLVCEILRYAQANARGDLSLTCLLYTSRGISFLHLYGKHGQSFFLCAIFGKRAARGDGTAFALAV